MPIISKSNMRGSSLIEVMIALFVLAIGLLGFAGLQTEGMTMGRQAYMHSQAAFLAQDIVERMVGNIALAKQGGYSMDFGQTIAAPNPACDTGTTVCSATLIADYDRSAWLANVTASLPAGEASIESTLNGATTTITVTVQYQLAYGRLSKDEQAAGASAPTTYTYTLVTEL